MLALVAAAAAVLVVAGLSAVLLQRGPSAAPLPTDRRFHQPADRESAVWIVAHGRLVSYAAGIGGWTSNGGPPDAPDRVLAVWQHCRADDTGCRSAWRLTDWHGQQIATGRARSSASSFDGATVLPVGTFAVSADDGRHWADLTREQLPFDFVDSMAATSGGTLYVVGDPDGRGRWRLFRSTDASWTHFEQVPGARDVDQLTPGGPVVLGRTGSPEEPQLVAYDDRGNRTDVPIR